jgi:hypothetical protein
LKNVAPGNSVFSMLGILDVLTVCWRMNRTVHVLQFPYQQ